MITQIKIMFLTIYIALAFLAMGCSKNDNPGQSGGETYAKFSNTTAIARADQDSISVGVRWSQTLWQLSTAADGFVTGFSVSTGGQKEQKAISGSVYVRLKANLTEQPRSQEIVIKDLATGKEEKMTISQSALSASDKYTLNPDTKYQKVTGFGGMINASWTGNTQLSVQDIEKLYGADGLGLNIGRLMLYPNSSGWSREVAVAKRAQELGAILFASPWTPPTNLKSVNTNGNTNGEYLLPANYAAFAAHMKSYVDYYKSQGVNIYAVSVQNEPDYKVSYDGCSYTPQQMLDFVKQEGKNVGAKLIAGETVQFNKSYTDALLNDATAVNNFDIVATHLYGFNFRTTVADYPLARQHNKEVWMTEHLFNETSSGYDWLWLPSLKTTLAEEIHDCMINNFNAYIYWYLKRYYGFMGEDRDAANPADYYTVANGAITKRGYIISHYAKYATGRTRIAITAPSASSVLATAYAGTNDYTIVLTNRSESAVIVDLASPKNISKASAVETNAVNNMTSKDYYISNDRRSLKLRMSPNSMVSVKLEL
ncbi:glycoside hydrolase [Niabella aquatica]